MRARRSLSASSRAGRRGAVMAVRRLAVRKTRYMLDTHQRIDRPIAAFARGEIVVVTDDDDRENEGDLFVAASHGTPEKMAFIIRHTSRHRLRAADGRDAQRLHLDPMVSRNDAPHRHRLHRLGRLRARHDHRHLGRRAHQYRARARQRQCRRRRFRAPRPCLSADREGRRRADALRPYRGRDRSVPARAARAGRRASANWSTTTARVMRGPQIAAFAEKHGLKRLSIADLIAYRQAREKLVERVGEFPVEPRDRDAAGLRLCHPVRPGASHGLRLWPHRRRPDMPDAAAPRRRDRRRVRRRQDDPRRAARFKDDGRGVIVYLRDGTAGVPVTAIPQNGETESEAARIRQWREIGLGAQILKDLGISLDPARWPRKSSPMWALAASASRSCRPRRLTAEPPLSANRPAWHHASEPAGMKMLRRPAVIALLSVAARSR